VYLQVTRLIKESENARAATRARGAAAVQRAKERAAAGDMLGTYAARDEVLSVFDSPFQADERKAALAEVKGSVRLTYTSVRFALSSCLPTSHNSFCPLFFNYMHLNAYS
jgi:hypothetical protein